MIKNILILLSLLLVVQQSTSQAIPLQQLSVLPDSITDFSVDNLGNIYLIGKGQRMKKLGEQLDSLGVYNDVRRYGNLDAVDVSNPLRILLFYKDFGTIVVLDRFLNVRTTIDLRRAGILQCSAIAQSYDNNIWVYDELDSKIKKIDENGQILLESPDFRVVFDVPPKPSKLEDYNRFVYAYDSTQGLLVMDYFGAYKNLIAFKGWSNVHGMAKGIVATDAKGLVYYQPGTIDTQHQDLPAAILQSQKVRINSNKLYALQADGRLHIYSLKATD